MRPLMSGLIAAGVLVLGSPGHAAENLACVDSGYDTAQSDAIETYVATLRANTLAQPPLPVLVALASRVEACSALHSWTEAAEDAASSYRLLVLIREGLRRSSPIPASALDRIDAQIDAEDPAQVDAMIQRVGSRTAGASAAPAAIDLQIFQRVTEAANVRMTSDIARFIGAWLASRGRLRSALTQFAEA